MPRHRRHAHSASWGSTVETGTLDARLLQVIDAALAGCIFFVPLAMGGWHPLGRFALVSLAVVAALAWSIRQGLRRDPTWRVSSAYVVLAAGALLAVLQILPFGPSWVARLSPHVAEILPLWRADAPSAVQFGTWPRLSLTPAETLDGLVLFLAYGLVFFVAVQRIRAIEDLERLLRWCGLSAAVMAAFGLLQYLTANGKFFWFYEHPHSTTLDVVKGSFANRNHFAHFLALGIGPLIWWVQNEQYRRARRKAKGEPTAADPSRTRLRMALLLGIVAFVLLAGLLSLSRGGNVALFVAAGVCTAVCYRASAVGGKFVAAMAAAGVVVVALVVFAGVDRVGSRLGTLSSGSLEEIDQEAGRRNIWAAVLRAIPHFAAFGSGIGSHRDVYPMYYDAPLEARVTFTHAENSYLQVGLETGGAGLLLAAVGIGLSAAWCLGGLRNAVSHRAFLALGAIAASLSASILHAVVDFVWYAPGCMVVVAILAAGAFRARQLAGDRAVRHIHSRPLPRAAAWAFALTLVVAGGGMVWNQLGPVFSEGPWRRYLLSRALASKPLARPGANDEEERTPEAIRKAQEARVNTARQRVEDLQTVLRWEPRHAQAHLELAQSYLRLFDLSQMSGRNSMSLSDVRDAVLRSPFPSQQALETWLARAVGEHWTYLQSALEHTRAGLRECPLQGEGYLFLSEMCFLEGANETVKNAYLAQALVVRPYDGDVLYAVAQQALRAGDPEGWLDYLHRSFAAGRVYQQRLLGDLVSHAPPEGVAAMIEFLLEEFQPEREATRALYYTAAQLEDPDRFATLPPEKQPAALEAIRIQLAPLRQYFARKAEAEAETKDAGEAAQLWLDAQECYTRLAQNEQALRCARRALKCDPNNYTVRYQLALTLIDCQDFAEAERQLHWCLQRRPDERSLAARFQEALRGKLDQESGVMSDRLLPTWR